MAEPAAPLSLAQTAQLLLACGVLGVAAYLLVLSSFFMVPTIRAQHPAASLVVWQAGCGLLASLGFVAAYFVQVRRVWAGHCTRWSLERWLRFGIGWLATDERQRGRRGRRAQALRGARALQPVLHARQLPVVPHAHARPACGARQPLDGLHLQGLGLPHHVRKL